MNLTRMVTQLVAIWYVPDICKTTDDFDNLIIIAKFRKD
jgi:hypothetical protein